MRSMVSKALAALWILLGIGLLLEAMSDTLKWQSDPIYAKVGLTFDWTGFVAGSAALFLGIWLLLGVRTARWPGYLIAGAFMLYTASFLILGDQGAVFYRFALPLAVLTLGVITAWQIGHGQATDRGTAR